MGHFEGEKERGESKGGDVKRKKRGGKHSPNKFLVTVLVQVGHVKSLYE